MLRRALVLVASSAALGCASSRAPARTGGPAAGGTETPAPSSPATESVRACTHDAKDLAPCVEDCDRGIVFACTVVAGRVERGDRAPLDPTRALRLHERSCELGDASSCVSAARMHAVGSGAPPSRARQIELLGRACMQGDVLACAVPAKAFDAGSGVPRDARRATELWQRACAGGVASACAALGEESN